MATSLSPLHGLWGAAYYGFIGLMCVIGPVLLTPFCLLLDSTTPLLGLGTGWAATFLPEAGSTALVGAPVGALGTYYFRHRSDPAFLRSSAYGRAIWGGVGIPFLVFGRKVLPPCFMLAFFLDLVPAALALVAVNRAEGKHD